MEKLNLRIVTAEELGRRIKNHESVDKYYAIGKYTYLQGCWMKKAENCTIRELDSAILVEIYVE